MNRDGQPRKWGITLLPRHLVALSLLLTVGCHWPGKPNPDDRPVPPAFVLKFGALFKRNCAGCHGPDGTLGPAPPLNDPLFRAIVPEKELKAVISKGRRSASGTDRDPRTPMPAFAREQGGTLSPEQIQVLVYEIKGIPYWVGKGEVVRADKGTAPPSGRKVEHRSPAWKIPPAPPKDTPPYLASKTGDSKRGARVFGNACAMCHGKAGTGGQVAGVELTINDTAFLALVSDKALRRIVITGRPDLGMPNYAEQGEARMDDFKP